jgi:hypothetical protein
MIRETVRSEASEDAKVSFTVNTNDGFVNYDSTIVQSSPLDSRSNTLQELFKSFIT